MFGCVCIVGAAFASALGTVSIEKLLKGENSKRVSFLMRNFYLAL